MYQADAWYISFLFYLDGVSMLLKCHKHTLKNSFYRYFYV